jgi:ubiquinone biosynthesis protein UbiJ
MIPPTRILMAAADKAVNRWLRMDPDSLAKLAALSGKTVHLRILEPLLDMRISIAPDAITIHEYTAAAAAADVMIEAATPATLLRLARGDSYAEQDIHMQGNMHTAKALQRLLRGIDIDWEEQLAQLIGDIPAHQLGNLTRTGLNWGQQVLQKFWLDVSEYLRYEAELLPARHSVEFFLSDIDTLRSDLDRLEARIRRLQRTLK